jgi:hypothetical protein
MKIKSPNWNPEITSNKATHITEKGDLVKVFTSTVRGEFASAEILSGPDQGKWTTVELNKCKAL